MRALIWPDQADSSVHSISSLDQYRTHFVDQYQGISCVQKNSVSGHLQRTRDPHSRWFAKFSTNIEVCKILNVGVNRPNIEQDTAI